MQQRHRIAAARHADEVTAGRRKLGDDLGIEPEFLFGRRLHAVEEAIGVESRQGAAVYKPPFVWVGGLESAAP
jgi:hypothetical protein